MTELDDDSIRVLLELEKGELTAPELAKRTNLSRGQVHYRLKNKISDRVTQTGKRENPGSAAPTSVWTLSDEGRATIDDLDETPQTFTEIAERSFKASEDAESAKESVQEYRKTVNRLKDRQDTLKSAVGTTWEDLEDTNILTQEEHQQLDSRISGIKKILSDDLDELQTELDDHAYTTRRERAELSSKIEKLNRRIGSIETRLNNREEAVDRRLERIEKRLDSEESRTLRDFLPF